MQQFPFIDLFKSAQLQFHLNRVTGRQQVDALYQSLYIVKLFLKMGENIARNM
jgi:DNA-directed RNA polymerase delta subunit